MGLGRPPAETGLGNLRAQIRPRCRSDTVDVVGLTSLIERISMYRSDSRSLEQVSRESARRSENHQRRGPLLLDRNAEESFELGADLAPARGHRCIGSGHRTAEKPRDGSNEPRVDGGVDRGGQLGLDGLHEGSVGDHIRVGFGLGVHASCLAQISVPLSPLLQCPPMSRSLRHVLIASFVMLGLAGSACSSPQLVESELRSTTTTTIATSFIGPDQTGTNIAKGMKGLSRASLTTDSFRTRITAIDPNVMAFGPAAAAYDAVLSAAIAAEVARTDAPGRIAEQLIGVTQSGEVCATFESCRVLALSDLDLDFEGASGGLQLLANGDVGEATFSAIEIDGNGSAVIGDAVSAQADEPDPAGIPRAVPTFGPPGDGVLTIATLLPMGGLQSDVAGSALAGVKLAVEELNRDGGVTGEPVELIPDESGDGSQGSVLAAALRSVDAGADVVIAGGPTGVAAASLETLTSSGLIVFSPTDSSRSLSTAADRGLLFRSVASEQLEATALGNVVASGGFTKVAIATDATTDGRATAADVAASLTEAGAAVTTTVEFQTAQESTGSDSVQGAKALLDSGPEAIVIVTTTQGAAGLIAQLAAGGKPPATFPVFGTEGNMTPELPALLISPP